MQEKEFLEKILKELDAVIALLPIETLNLSAKMGLSYVAGLLEGRLYVLRNK